MYTLKPLPIDVFAWTGQDPAAWPQWVKDTVMAVVMVPGTNAPCLIIREDKHAWVMPAGESLVRHPDGRVVNMTAQQFADQVDGSADAAPTPAPAIALPPQPYEPVDHVMINGVDTIAYFASGPGNFGKTMYMPAAQWAALNPAVTTGLH